MVQKSLESDLSQGKEKKRKKKSPEVFDATETGSYVVKDNGEVLEFAMKEEAKKEEEINKQRKLILDLYESMSAPDETHIPESFMTQEDFEDTPEEIARFEAANAEDERIRAKNAQLDDSSVPDYHADIADNPTVEKAPEVTPEELEATKVASPRAGNRKRANSRKEAAEK